MNNRIEELLWLCTEESIDGPYASPYVDHQKFAELIVKECIEVLDKDDGATPYFELLKQHFGVE